MSHEQYLREYEVSFKIPSKFGFDEKWIRYWDHYNYKGMNKYILVDPANEKKRNSDYTAMFVVGMSDDDNYYVIDLVRERMNLTERTTKLFELHRKYRPVATAYEQYGIQADIQHIQYVQAQQNYRFSITAVGGNTKKEDRIRTLVPLFENERIYLPHGIQVRTGTGMMRDVIKEFIEECLSFPVGTHDDMLDCLARINDPKFHMRPAIKKHKRLRSTHYNTNYKVI